MLDETNSNMLYDVIGLNELKTYKEQGKYCPYHGRWRCDWCYEAGHRAIPTCSIGNESRYLMQILHQYKLLHLYRARRIPTKTLSDILMENRICGMDLLKTDVECLDLAIMNELMQAQANSAKDSWDYDPSKDGYFTRMWVLGKPETIIYEGHTEFWAESDRVNTWLCSWYGYEVLSAIPKSRRA